MVDSRKEVSRQQNHYGSGPLIGGDNNGSIRYELLAPQTKSMLAKLSEDAPDLAALLRKALRDGFISPDVAEALMFAARNINEDVADALLIAGRNINEDVAGDLRVAGENINEEVAYKFIGVNRELTERVHELNGVTESLRVMVGQVGTDTATASRTARMFIQPDPRSTDKWWFRLKLTCCSSGAGLLAAVILMRIHLGIYATLAGVFILLFAILLHFAKARR